MYGYAQPGKKKILGAWVSAGGDHLLGQGIPVPHGGWNEGGLAVEGIALDLAELVLVSSRANFCSFSFVNAHQKCGPKTYSRPSSLGLVS